jgi:hypothetical protein
MKQFMDHWTDQLRQTLHRYDETLLRQVADKLCKPRNHWPLDELIDRCLAAVVNPAMVDRRLKELDEPGRCLLSLIGHSRQPRWQVGNLVEMAVSLGNSDGLQAVQSLFEAGLLYPEVAERGRIKQFDQWLGKGNSHWAYFHPAAGARTLELDADLPQCPGALTLQSSRERIHEADGLEWPLRLAALWQQVAAAPLRRTQQRDFFKRDLERLRSDALLGGVPADNLCELPDPGLLAVALALGQGLIQDEDGELVAGTFSPSCSEGLPALLASLWAVLLHLDTWNVNQGWQPGETHGNPYPGAYLLAILILGNLPEERWIRPGELASWVVDRHPYWKNGAVAKEDRKPASARKKASPEVEGPASGLSRFFLGLAYQLRLVQAAKGPDGDWVVRLSPMGRWILGLADKPPSLSVFPQTLLVQPNLELLVYRQGLTPDLIGRLSRFATWKNLGAACTLQLEPDSVYRALESGESFESIVQTLERHSMKPTPAPVVEALRTWSNKRDRISVYPAAALFEFASAEDMQEAMARGLPAVRLGEKLAAVANESAIDYRHFRLVGTRDYVLPPEKCVEIEPDGVTLSIDLARSDLLLETELARFAELVPGGDVNNRRRYRLTPSSIAAGREQGVNVSILENWFWQRSGQALTSAARLLLTGPDSPPAQLRRQLILHVANEEIADGLEQWPATRGLIQERLGPTAILVLEENVPALEERLQTLGITLQVAGESAANNG